MRPKCAVSAKSDAKKNINGSARLQYLARRQAEYCGGHSGSCESVAGIFRVYRDPATTKTTATAGAPAVAQIWLPFSPL
jgi:hypothetical protein